VRSIAQQLGDRDGVGLEVLAAERGALAVARTIGDDQPEPLGEGELGVPGRESAFATAVDEDDPTERRPA
jgi:hypothetical protein